MIRVLLAGEGPNELGGEKMGVLQTLLEKVRPDGWEIVGRIRWKDIPKLVVGPTAGGDGLAVQRLVLLARERGCHVVVFARDRDGRRATERAIERALEEHEGPTRMAGGVAIETLEAWILALDGRAGSEGIANPAAELAKVADISKKTTAMAAIAMKAKLPALPEDAASLRRWLRRCAGALGTKSPV